MRNRLSAVASLLFGVGACAPVPPAIEESDEPIEMMSEAVHADATCNWRVQGTAARAQITGGPWTLGQGPATQSDPAAGYPGPNPGTQNFAPYFWPFVVNDKQSLLGYFDYRPRNMEEAVVAARSYDGGRSWEFLDKALTFNPNPIPNPLTGNENGQGHPFVMKVRRDVLLYTLDRTPGIKDVGGLIVHRITPTRKRPLRGAPADEMPLSLATVRTTGLLNPDGIIGEVPGSLPQTIVYLQRVLGTSGPLSDVTTPRLATTENGINFNDAGPVVGLQDDGTLFVGSRGQILRQKDGQYVLIFSGGIAADNASDAYHYIGCATSSDLRHWTVGRGLANPILSIEPTPASGQPQSWWMGRVFGPTMTIDRGGHQATLIFAGYHTANPNNDFSDYRQIGVATLVPDPPGAPISPPPSP